MTLRRNKCVKGATQKHDEFIDRIRKSLYFGGDTLDEDMEVSRPLAEYASELFSEPHKGHSLHRLSRVTAGSIHSTPCSLIMALIYFDRLNLTDPSYVKQITPHELFIVSMMISTKFYASFDEEIYLSDWAEDGNMTEDRLKQLEREFLNAIDWNIYISSDQFFSKLAKIELILAKREGLRRGWLTYTELVQMLPSFTLVKFLFHNITVMAVSYTAGVMTIAGAFLLASQLPMTSLQRNSNVSSSVRSSESDVLNKTAEQETHVTAEEQQQLNTTSQALETTVTLELNTTFAAFNVEAELLKLNRQYREEALLEEVRNRRNEFVAATHNDLINTIDAMARQRASDWQSNWISLKEEYNDENLQDLRALQTLITTVQKIIVIMAFIYGQGRQFRHLQEHLIQSTTRWCGRKADHASAAFVMLQIFIVYKACGREIFNTTIYLKDLLI